MRYVLGINCSGFLSSACLLEEGRIRFAICEERLSRIKRDSSFPHLAIQYCCDAAGISLADIHDAYVGWHPRFYIGRSDNSLPDALRSRGKMSYLALNELAAHGSAEIVDLVQTLTTEDSEIRVHFVDHHHAHLANAYGQSGFGKADFLVLDGFGEVTTGMCGAVSRDGVDVAAQYPTPHSLGSFYSAFTDYLGFTPEGDEWKVMALSALGDSTTYYEKIRALVRVSGLAFELDLSFFEHYIFFKPRYYAQKLIDLLGPPLLPGEEPGQHHIDIVAAVQRVAEETVFELLRNLHAEQGGDALVLGGGFFMNSVCNGKIQQETPYQSVYIGGSPDDSGVSLGSALYGSHRDGGTTPSEAPLRHNYFGRQYTSDEVREELDRRKLRYERVDNPSSTAAGLIREGRILGWFQGASEFGQRALGARSILADPTVVEMKERVNASVKYREGFRPFAPSILKDRQAEVLDIGAAQSAYFMENVFPIREEWRPKIPAVIHFDGTGRPQTVDRDLNPRYYDLIQAFEKLSGVPVVLNTSFNVNGMPLVETPGDAISCFYQCGLDALVIEDYLLVK